MHALSKSGLPATEREPPIYDRDFFDAFEDDLDAEALLEALDE